MKIKKIYKWIFALILAVIIVVFGFTFTVKEGSCAIVSRFGEVRAIYMDSGLHFKLPYPFENVYTYDTRSQYMDSGYTETLTNDKKNVILQTYLVWHIEDPRKFYNSVGDNDKAEKYLNDLTANVKNGVMGNYELSALVSTDLENIKIDEISEKIEKSVSVNALKDYGIKIEKIKIKRLALPTNNIESVFEQMIADREKQVTKLLSEGERDAAIIMSEANAKAAERGGADCISLINTLTGMAIDVERRRPIIANNTGGVSGAGVKPIAVRMVYEASQAVNIPVIGMGGITCAEDAIEFLMAGATAVQVGTANFTDPYAMPKIIKGLNDWCDKHNVANVSDLTGTLVLNGF